MNNNSKKIIDATTLTSNMTVNVTDYTVDNCGVNDVCDDDTVNTCDVTDVDEIDVIAELDYIYEQKERARVARELEHKVAMRQIALKHALMCAIMLQ